MTTFLDDLARSQRPVILVGGGAYRARHLISDFAQRNNIPIIRTWNAHDVAASDNPNYCGVIGTYGGPGRNFAVQNADLLMILGCRLSGRITGGMPQTFARAAKKWWFDIGSHILDVHQPVKPDDYWIGPCEEMDVWDKEAPIDPSWLARCIDWRERYDPVEPHMLEGDFHHYGFMRRLSDYIPNDAIIVADTGGNVIMMGHAFKSKTGQRIFTSNGNTPMGFALCGALGAWFADKSRPIYCIIGDGGMSMNPQELQTLNNYGAKIKIIVINNHVYGNTVSYQRINYAGRLIGCGPDGYKPVNFCKLALAYDLPYMALDNWVTFDAAMEALEKYNPILLDVIHDNFATYEPRISRFDLPIEDMYPFLPRDEFRAQMIIEPMEGWERNV